MKPIIKQLELKKICIAQTMYDPHVLMNFISPYTKKRAESILKEIKLKYDGQQGSVEYAVAKAIFDIYKEGPRKQRFAYVLLMQALNSGMIGKPAYMKIRESMGVSEYSKDTEEFLKKEEVVKNPDVFDMVTDTSKTQSQGES